MASSSLGATITADAINNFFTLKPLCTDQHKQQKATLHRPGSVLQQLMVAKKNAKERQMNASKGSSKNDDLPYEKLADVPDQLQVETENQVEIEYKGPDHPALNVYDNYNFEHEYDNELPITEHREWVIGTIESNQVTIIQGATGSGKTTQVPQYILDYYYQQRKYCNIVVTQPRRIAAESISKRVCDERGWEPGHVVGYQVGRGRNVSEDTRITYMTTGVLLQKMIKNKNMNEYTHVILDEVHERDQDVDLAMLIVKKFLTSVSKHVKVILMSATMDCSLYSKYFSIIVRNQLEGAPVVSVEGRMFNVAEYYLDHLHTLGEIPFQSLSEPELSENCYRMAKTLIMEFDNAEVEAQGAQVRGEFAAERGTVLVFLPGFPEIDALHKHLEKIEIDRNLQVLILHSQITSLDQSKIFRKAERGKRKVILSTNIAESSITVPDIKYVIDFCLTKNVETDCETNYQSLRLHWASKSSLKQRKGRAGRVSDGECFRLITHDFYQQLPEYGIPEMQRCPLTQVILHIKMLDIGDPCTLLKMALQPPEINEIRRTILLLKEVGALTVKQNERINPLDGDLTFVGKVLGSLPTDVRIGKLLILGFVYGYLNECLVIAAALSLKSVFARPFKKNFEAYSHKMQWANWSFSDCIAALNCYQQWKRRKETTGFGREGERQWGRKNYVETRMMQEVDNLVKELLSRLSQFNIRPNSNPHRRNEYSQNDMLILKVIICGAFYPFYFISGDIDDADCMKQLSGHDPFSTVMVNNVPSPGIFYKDAIASLFRKCGKGKFLHFESSRCYIEFDRTVAQHNPTVNPVIPAVYLAVKMRQLRTDLRLFVHKEKTEEVQRRLELLQIANSDMTSLRSGSFTTALSSHVPQRSTQVALKTSGYISVHVTAVIEAGHFWAHYGTQETFQQIKDLQHSINAMNGSNLSRIPNGVKLSDGEIILAWFEDEYYRAQIVSQNGQLAEVFFLDYGNTDTLPRDMLRRCPADFLKLPFQAFECYLCGIRPVFGEWSREANARFHEMVHEQILIAKIFSVAQNSVRLDLYYPDSVTPEPCDNHVNAILVNEGFAQSCEESYRSKMAKRDSETMHKALTEGAELLKAIGEEDYKVEEYDATMIRLRGPSTPYELSFYNLTANGRVRATKVEQDSVNSVFICEEPQDKHPRLMVSANVGVNAAGNTIIAKDTTVLPNIHGIASIIPVLFAPIAEYRISKDRTRITGAICGLGYVEGTGYPILPEHDMEVVFDVEFTKEDIQTVNLVRKGINIAFRNEEIYGMREIERVQTYARHETLKLIHRQREDVERVMFTRPYEWNQIPDIERLNPPVEDSISVPLYAYHCGVWLQPLEDKQRLEHKKKLDELSDLYEMEGRSTEPFKQQVECPLCHVVCRHAHAVSLHLNSIYHKREEEHYHSQI